MDTERALRDLGVHEDTLTGAEKASLDEQGFVVLGGMFSPAQAAAFRRRTEELAAQEGEEAGKEAQQEKGVIRLADLINKDPIFEYCFTHARLLAAARRVLGPSFRVDSLNARFSLPGDGHQALHADWGSEDPAEWEAVRQGRYFGMNSLWLLDPFTPENGATRVVPGTHRSGGVPRDEMADLFAPHPRELLLLAPAGTVVAFNSHLWHGGTLNRTGDLRRVLHMAYVPRHRKQLTNQRQHLRPETSRRLTPQMKCLLDV
ncbi:MAG: phytanoyl-CoA dioxygenase family protein [Candidatus Latescibacteria bacterium]|nr:phytanoyl-CoA dioxygenase family protein [Candidatus Latescibacterota bacterium]